MMLDYTEIAVRDAAILTNAFVAGTIINPNNVGTQDQNQLVIYWDFTIGSLTSAELKVEFGNLLAEDLAYDGQTANFAVGEVVTGGTSGAFAEIIADTDAGATGTLTLGPIKTTRSTNGYDSFVDNETLTGDQTGVAVVNGTASVSDFGFYQETSSSLVGGTSTDSILQHTVTATGKYRLAMPLLDRYVRISVNGTGTVTSSSAKIIALVGRV